MSPGWQLKEHHASLRLARLAASLDLWRPDLGLHDLRVDSAALPTLQILQPDLPSIDASTSSRLIEAYGRQGDLVVTYGESEQRPFRTQVYWRAQLTPAEDVPAAIELLASMQTDLLDSNPQLTTRTRLQIDEALHLPAGESKHFEPIAFADDRPAVFDRNNSTGAFLFRLYQSHWSYLEIVHPLNFHQSELQIERAKEGVTANVAHQLFAHRLEKGVILRARVLGQILPRANDLSCAIRCQAEFAVMEPPLSV